MCGLLLTHWGRVMHICVGNLTIIGSDNGLSPERRQTIIWTSAGILLIGPLGTNFSEILIGVQTFSFKKMHLKMASAKWRPFCLGLNVLMVGSLLEIRLPIPAIIQVLIHCGLVMPYTVRCRYNAVNFLQNPHNRHPIAHPSGRDMGCLLWI